MSRYTNDEVIGRFVRGKTDGKSNRMAIVTFEGWTLLWGYGHALYGARDRDSGTLFVYNGWHGRSSTTSSHINSLKRAAKNVYGEPRDGGMTVRVAADGTGEVDVEQEPPRGYELVITDEGKPGTHYGKLSTSRPELQELTDRHVPSPNGYGG